MKLQGTVEHDVYGIIVFATSLYELSHPPHPTPILFHQLHPSIWWGAFMGIAGAAHVICHRPKKDNAEIRTLLYE